MSAAAPAKFRFDLDLGHREERNSILTDSAIASLIAAARAEGRAEGLIEGEQSAAAEAARRLASAAEAVSDHAAAQSAALDDSRRQTLTDALGLAATIGRKLAGHLLAAQPLGEIEALITECLASLDAVPHLVIHCAPAITEAVRERALSRIAVSGFAGRLIVMDDPDMQPGDAKLEWVDGGVVRDRAGLEAEIDRRIANFLAARANAGVTRHEH